MKKINNKAELSELASFLRDGIGLFSRLKDTKLEQRIWQCYYIQILLKVRAKNTAFRRSFLARELQMFFDTAHRLLIGRLMNAT